MSVFFARTALLASLLVISTSSHAATLYSAVLSGAAEVPPNGSTATGNVLLTLSDAQDSFALDVSFSGLSSATTMAHIHCCVPAGVNAGIATAPPAFPDFPLGVTSGSYMQSFSLLDPTTYSSAFVTANGGTVAGARSAFLSGLAGGLSYFNLHTVASPGGEIRGQLAAVPEPAGWALMIAGFGLVGGALRSRLRAVQRRA